MALLKRKRIGLTDAMEVVTRFVNACNRHDADGVASCLHPDFDSIQPMYPTRNFRGADQVRRNWQAIFDAEPGFRLTVLRSAATDDTVWLELHGAGEDAEVAGIFIMGIVGDRIRWARIYSSLVEPVPEGVGVPPAPAQQVPRPERSAATDGGDVVEEQLIAPVLDMERSSRRRRRRGHDDAPAATEADAVTDEAAAAAPEAVEAGAAAEGESAEVDATAVVEDAPPAEAEAELPAEPEVAEPETDEESAQPVAGADGEAAEAEAADVVGAQPVEKVEIEPATVVEPAAVVEQDVPVEPAVVETDAEPAAAADDDAGPDTEAVAQIVWDDDEPAGGDEKIRAEDGPPPAPAEPARPEPPRRLFGKRSRP